jgi:hypothetical protein
LPSKFLKFKLNMKKIILSVAAVFAFGFANAQEATSSAQSISNTKGEQYLPKAGEWAIGFNADGIFEYVGNAFSGDTHNSAPFVGYQKAGTFVGKKFITDNTAYRVVANLAVGADKDEVVNGLGERVETKNSGFDLTAGLGKEWRRGSTRLQGFYGADALLTVNSSKEEINTVADADGTFISNVENKSGLGFGLGVQGFIGAEYFIFPKMAIGAQYTYRVGFDIAGKPETTVTTPGGSVTAEGGSANSFGLGGVGITSINLTLHF